MIAVRVNATPSLPPLKVVCDMPGLTSCAGIALLTGLADALGLTEGLVRRLSVHSRAVRHEPGRVARDLAVMLAGSCECLTDLGALRDQEVLFGEVASRAVTAYRCVERLDHAALSRIRAARGAARARAWQLGQAPRRVIIDIDAPLTRLPEGAAGRARSCARRSFPRRSPARTRRGRVRHTRMDRLMQQLGGGALPAARTERR
jgi:hypothetical protein